MVPGNKSQIKFLLNPNEITQEFADLQNRARSIRLAVAWAMQGTALDMICNAKCRVEAIVGTGFNATDPIAIESLQKVGKVYVNERKDNSLFHPKVYLFQLRSQHAAIIGSPNLSDAAFTRNDEAAVRLFLNDEYVQELLDYFKRLRGDSREVTSTWLKKYRSRYKLASKRGITRAIQRIEGPQSQKSSKQRRTTQGKLLTYNWKDYFSVLTKLSDPDGEDRLFNNTDEGSYLKTLEILKPILRKPFNQVKGGEFRKLIGARETIPDAGWFGSLTAGGRLVKQLQHNSRLRQVIATILPIIQQAKTEEEALRGAEQLFTQMMRYKYVKHAAITRFLAIYRPDRYFSVNNKSLKKQEMLFGIAQAELKKWDGYAKAIQMVWRAKWYTSPRPKGLREAKVWAARVALLDLYAYEP
jgi:HKD family nuclease